MQKKTKRVKITKEVMKKAGEKMLVEQKDKKKMKKLKQDFKKNMRKFLDAIKSRAEKV